MWSATKLFSLAYALYCPHCIVSYEFTYKPFCPSKSSLRKEDMHLSRSTLATITSDSSLCSKLKQLSLDNPVSSHLSPCGPFLLTISLLPSELLKILNVLRDNMGQSKSKFGFQMLRGTSPSCIHQSAVERKTMTFFWDMETTTLSLAHSSLHFSAWRAKQVPCQEAQWICL